MSIPHNLNSCIFSWCALFLGAGCSFIGDEQLAYRLGSQVCDTVWYLDEDGDGYGFGNPIQGCEGPNQNYVENGDDCDDSNPNISPEAIEDCSTVVDEDCDGSQNGTEMLDCQDWFVDADGDGFGNENNIQCVCVPEDGFVEVIGDCDDSNREVHPNMTEICNDGLDNNCDGLANGCGYDASFVLGDSFGTILGSTSRDYAGNALAAGPILPNNKMGLVIGASGVDSVTEDVGAVYITAMAPGTTTVDEAVVHIYNSTVSNFGNVLLANRDLNSDGVADLVIAADSLPKNNQNGVGGVYVFYGPLSQDTDISAADIVLQGGAANDRFGMDIAVMDGTASSLWIGAPHEDSAAANAGAVFVFEDPSTAIPTFEILGTSAGQRFGHSLSEAGDVNGDGMDDIIIGAYGQNGNRGAGYLFHSGVTGNSVATDADAIWEGLQPDDQVGAVVQIVGDLNGDGYDNIWIGAPNISTAYIVDGSTVGEKSVNDALIQVVGATESQVGFSVARIGDINGDAYDDLVFGGHGISTVYILYGPLTGVYNASIDGIPLLDSGVDQVGYSLSGLGDFNNNGIDDIAVGARVSSLSDYKSGAVFLLEGLGL